MPKDPRVRNAVLKKYFGDAEDWEGAFLSRTAELKRMSGYAGIGMLEVPELPLSLYLLIRRDSWVESVSKTTDGPEILKSIWRLGQTKADLNKVRQFKERGE